MKRASLAILVVILVGALAVPALAGRGDGRGRGDCPLGGGLGDPGRGPGGRAGFDGIGHLMMLKDKLALSADQVNRLEDMAVDFRTEMVDLRASVEKAQIKLRALQRDNADAGSVGKAIDEVSRMKAEVQKRRYSHLQQMRGVLSAEQLTELERLRAERPGDCPMGGPGQGPGQGQGRGRGQGWAPDWDDDDD